MDLLVAGLSAQCESRASRRDVRFSYFPGMDRIARGFDLYRFESAEVESTHLRTSVECLWNVVVGFLSWGHGGSC